MDSQVVAVIAEPDEPHTHRCGNWSCERRYRCLTQQQHTTHQVQMWSRDGTIRWVEIRFCSFECECILNFSAATFTILTDRQADSR